MSDVLAPGVAIDPVRSATTVVSPIAGKALKVLPHAFVVHLGIDTRATGGKRDLINVSQSNPKRARNPYVRMYRLDNAIARYDDPQP